MAASVWQAMAGHPVRFVRSRWPWRSLAYVVSSLPVIAIGWLAVLPLLLFPPLLLLAGPPIGALERHRLALMDPVAIPDPHPPAPPGGWAWVRQRVTAAATWRELGYGACLLSVLALLDLAAVIVLLVCLLLLTLPLSLGLGANIHITLGTWTVETVGQACAVAAVAGVPATVVTLYGISVLGGAQAAFARWLLAPTGIETSRQVEELALSRSRLVNAFEAERRRIERDLHDGAQQHLVLLTMKLGLAERQMTSADARARHLVGEAHDQARLALITLRDQIRGIHPQILTDLGLTEAIRELAERCPIPVEVDLDLPGRLPPEIESTAYFVVSEALTNAVRHAAATRIRISGGRVEQRLTLAIVDDGTGGAEPSRGSGLRGLADRVAVVAGTLEITSPQGGPTTVRIDLPCR
ncbi:sensor histidine kinase [Actinoplanes palleronii]|uniref:histidine kinase n=1 Tax=Actinoplanes palleronii TaxID=113570 RepID=A0ABQ4BFP8_9ACTN|nr:sensor domain-containing protein [Actinoplanes palleronii]GIE69493.1 histidine kinase [Actinoplanes palleronii]